MAKKFNLFLIFVLFSSMLAGAWASWVKLIFWRDVFAIIFLVSLAMTLFLFIYASIREGHFQASVDEDHAFNTYQVARKKNPKSFWNTIGLMGFVAASSLLFALYLCYEKLS